MKTATLGYWCALPYDNCCISYCSYHPQLVWRWTLENSKTVVAHHNVELKNRSEVKWNLKLVFLWQNCSNLIPKTSIQGILSTSSGLPDTRIWFAQSRFSGGEKRRDQISQLLPHSYCRWKGGVWKISRMLTFCPRSIWVFSSLVGRFSFLVESNQRSQTRLRKSSLIASGRSTNKTIPSHFRLQPLKSPFAFWIWLWLWIWRWLYLQVSPKNGDLVLKWNVCNLYFHVFPKSGDNSCHKQRHRGNMWKLTWLADCPAISFVLMWWHVVNK